MKHEELGMFTHEELGHFTHEELSLAADDLLQKAENDDRKLPVKALLKLQKLCVELNQTGASISVPKKGLTIAEACTIITLVIAYMNSVPDISRKWYSAALGLIEFIASLLQ